MDPEEQRLDSRRAGKAGYVRSVALRLIIIFTIFHSGWVFSAETMAVLYPQIRGPYKEVFSQIIDGIDDQATRKVQHYELPKNPDLNRLRAKLKKDKAGVIVALGRRGLTMGQNLADEFPIVAGAVLSAPGVEAQEMSGISLVPDPNLLFARLRQLAPGVERVMVVYNPGKNASLIRLGARAARLHGLDFQFVKAADLRSAAKSYLRLLEGKQLEKSALWLMQDRSVVDDKLILPMLLKQAWKKRFVVFSSNPIHVRRGALFSLYPDNVAMGRSLADLAEHRLSGGNVGKLVMDPLRDLLVAVNLRTAGHLGLKLSNKLRRNIDLVFPAR